MEQTSGEQNPQRNQLGFLLGVASFMILGFIVPTVFILDLDLFAASPNVLLAMVIVVYSSTRLSMLATTGERRLISLTFWVFVYVWLGISSLVQTVTQSYPWTGSYSGDTEFLSYAVILIGIITFDVGQSIGDKRAPVIEGLSRALASRELSYSRTIVVSLMSVALALALVAQIGGPASLFVSRYEFNPELLGAEDNPVFLLISNLLRVPVFISLIVGLCFWRQKTLLTSNKRFVLAAVLGVTLIVNAIVSNPVASPRFWIGTIGLSLAFVMIPWNKKFSIFGLSSALVLTFLLLFPYLDIFRSTTDVDLSRIEIGAVHSVLTNDGDYDVYQQVMNSVKYVEENGLTNGYQMLGSFLYWVPRSVWEDKPVSTGTLIAKGLGYNFTNISSPLWAEFYINWGILGSGVGLGIYGILTRMLEKTYVKSENSGVSLVSPLVIVFSAYQIYLLRGDLMSTLPYLVSALVFILFFTRPTAIPDNGSPPVLDTAK